MKPNRYLFFVVICLICHSIFNVVEAQQPYANEWINYQQSYFKIPVVEKGIFRINTDELRRAGFPVATTDPTKIQLFFRGKEQAIFIGGEVDRKLDDSDYILFYGEGNDGTQDSLLYVPNSAQPHKIYNLYSDTTAYFLTWRLDGQMGKRMDFYQAANSSNLVAEAYHRENLLVSNIKTTYQGMSEGLIYPLGSANGSQMSYYDYGEGWTGPELNKDKPFVKELSLENVYTAGFKPQIEVHLMGRDHRQHNIDVMVGNSANLQRTIETAQFQYFYPYLSKREIAFSDIAANNKTWVSTTSCGTDPNQPDDVYSVTYYHLVYPQRFDFQNKTQKQFNLSVNNLGNSYLEIPNVGTDASLFDLTDKNNPIRIGTAIDNGLLKAMVRNTNTSRNLFLTRQPLSVLGIQKVNFRNIDPSKPNFLLVTSVSLNEASKTYAAYRASVSGGSYDTLVVTMDLLTNQFNYGEFSPLAIKRFVQFMTDKGNPRFLFLVGRTQQVEFNRVAADRPQRDMVPSFGWPGSDNMFSAGLKGLPAFVPAVPAGRLWTDSPQTVLDYLAKVKEHEATKMDALWRKNILHLSGGISTLELKLFKGYMDEFKAKAKRQFLGANVTTITKKTDESIEYVGLANEVNDGAGIITLFGHSSLSVTDIDIGFVSSDVLGYRNKGHYPLVYANGCVLGNFTYGAPTYPIDWIGTKDRGAILFLAHSNLAYSFSLKNYADSFYGVFLGDSSNISRPFGEVQQRIIRKFLTTDDSPINRADAQEISLQGDPAVVVFPTTQPDYAITNKDLLISTKNNQPVSALSDSLVVRLVVSNFGLYQNKNLKIRLVRTLKDGTSQSYEQNISAIAYQDTIKFVIANDRNQTGINRFEATIDPSNLVAEMNENNNAATIDLNIPILGAYPLLPAEYAILPTNDSQPTATLVMQAVDNSLRNYVFEIDTSANFNSAFRQTQNLSSNWLPTWKVTLLQRDTTTYYWRVRYTDRPADDNNRWAESSFTIIKGSVEGWTQRQSSQFMKDQLTGLNLSPNASPSWTYQSTSAPIKAVLNGSSVGAFAEGYLKNQLSISDILLVANGNCGNNAVIATTLRRSDLRAYSVLSTYNCGSPPYVTNSLPDVQITNNQLLDKYLDAVQQGDYVLLMTSGNVQFDKWPTTTKAKLKEMGLSNERLAEMRSGRPYLFIGQKGAKALEKELLTDPNELAPSLKTVMLDNYTLKGTVANGQVVSTTIGPASSWGNGKWLLVNGEWSVGVFGVDILGKETKLATSQNLSQIDAAKYPYLKLVANLSNADINTPITAQLRQWLVSYKPVAEGSANSNLVSGFEKQEGEVFKVNVAFKNVADVAFRDSISVIESTYLPSGQVISNYRKIKRLQPNEMFSYDLDIQTLGRAGANKLVINFNPRQQPEQTFSNNIISLSYAVQPDRIAPTVDVFFDGRRIKNNEIVSAKPFILVQMKDENKYLFKRDTLGLELYLQSPNQNNFKRIAFNSPLMRFIPANNDNLFGLEFRPQTLPDGVYTLRVQGADASNNRTGIYIVSFRVINSPAIVENIVYPNPADTFVWFSFTVSGSEIPDEATIDVTDINGKKIATLSQSARVGANEWLWNNMGNFPNGTYFYKLQVKKNNQLLPLSEGVKAVGKVIIVR